MLTRARSLALLIFTVAALAGCGQSPARGASHADSAGGAVIPAVRSGSASEPGAAGGSDSAGGTRGAASVASGPFTPLPPNKLGRIPVLEYHLISDHDADYSRSRDTFRKELALVYSRGYRPITMSQMLNKDF